MKALRKLCEWTPALAIPALIWALILAVMSLFTSCAWAWGEAYRIRGGYYDRVEHPKHK